MIESSRARQGLGGQREAKLKERLPKRSQEELLGPSELVMGSRTVA